MEAWEAKLIAAAILWVVIWIPAVLPIKVDEIFRKRGPSGVYQLSVFACFGGGVFMGAYLMHVVPEVDHLIKTSLLEPNGITFPIGELIIGAGFFILIIVDQILHLVSATVEKVEKILHERRVSKANLIAEREQSARNTPVLPRKKDDSSIDSPVLRRKGHACHVESGLVKSDSAPNLTSLQHKYKPQKENDAPKRESMALETNGNGMASFTVSEDGLGNGSEPQFTVLAPVTIESDTNLEKPVQIDKEKLSAMKAIVLLIALSFDGIFSGLSCGLQVDTQAVWNLMVAIMAHEMVIAFMLGLQLMKSYDKKGVFLMSTFYSTTNPIGVLIGLIITLSVSDSSQFDLISGILQACCAGVFMYVAFLEILANEYVNKATVAKTIAIILGFTLMCLLLFIPSASPKETLSMNVTTIAP